MGKKLLVTEKPSVAMEFAKALKIMSNRKNGYIESEEWIITWCVGHRYITIYTRWMEIRNNTKRTKPIQYNTKINAKRRHRNNI